MFYTRECRPLRLAAQDAALSRQKHGFESRRGHRSTKSILFVESKLLCFRAEMTAGAISRATE